MPPTRHALFLRLKYYTHRRFGFWLDSSVQPFSGQQKLYFYWLISHSPKQKQKLAPFPPPPSISPLAFPSYPTPPVLPLNLPPYQGSGIGKSAIRYLFDHQLNNMIQHIPHHPSHPHHPHHLQPHKAPNHEHEEEHVSVGEIIKSMVYGGLDGTINILVIIISGITSNTSPSKILAMGLAANVGDCLGMGLGDYLSLKSQQDYIKSEKDREYYECEHMMAEEIKEAIEIFLDRGYSQDEAERLTELYTTNTDAFVNIMMLAELGLVEDDVEAWHLGLVTLIAFFLSGIFPLVPYIISWGIERSDRHNGLVCIMIGSFELLSLGYFKGQIINQPFDKRLQSGLEMLVFGLVVVFISYVTGGFFKQ